LAGQAETLRRSVPPLKYVGTSTRRSWLQHWLCNHSAITCSRTTWPKVLCRSWSHCSISAAL